MSHREPTVEQLDPMAAVNGLPITILGGVGVIAYTCVMTAFNWKDTTDPFAAVLAVVAVAAAFSVLGIAATPLRAPVTRPVHIAGILLLIGATALSAVATAGGNLYVQDDWGPVVIGLFGLFVCPYRPPRDIIVSAILAAVPVTVIVWVQAPTFVTPVPAGVFVVVALAPLFALSLSGAAFATVMLRMIVRWRDRAAAAVHADAAGQLPGIARSVQQDLVTVLNRDAVPFLAGVVAAERVAESDRVRAGALAGSLRRAMVVESDQTWLQAVVDELMPGLGAEIDDPRRLADLMSDDQRTAVRALLTELALHGELVPGGLAIGLDPAGRRVGGELIADFAVPTAAVRTRLAPYLAVIRVVFPSADVDVMATSLRVGFEYDQH